MLLMGLMSSLHQDSLLKKLRRVPQQNFFVGKDTTVTLCGFEINVKEVVVEIEEMNTNRREGLDTIHKVSQNNSGVR